LVWVDDVSSDETKDSGPLPPRFPDQQTFGFGFGETSIAPDGALDSKGQEGHQHHEGVDKKTRNAMFRQGLSIGVSLIPFGLAFGVSCTRAGLSWVQALGFSSLVFTGGSQFAAVGVLGDGGGVAAAIGAGLLLSIRSLVYGLVMAPTLKGKLAYRALASQLMIDESIAVSTAQSTPSARRMGYFVGGLSVFFFWNVTTLIGAIALKSNGDLITKFGLDATVPAAFAALIWPRLKDPEHRIVALLGALIALVLIPVAPAGIPIVASGFAVIGAFSKIGRKAVGRQGLTIRDAVNSSGSRDPQLQESESNVANQTQRSRE
jgi:predicted branched-subunit amino acid permease